jgi:hypothetical protein
MPRARTSPQAIEVLERERKALELRKGGATFEQIAQALGYSDRSNAHKAVRKAMRETIQEPAHQVRELELERLDVLLKALWPTALATGHKDQARTVERCLAIMARRSALLGLDAPQRMKVQYLDDDTFTELLGRLNAETERLLSMG